MPSMTDKCSVCHHLLSEHYTTHDGKKDGCSKYSPSGGDQRDSWPASTCECKGFAITYRPIRPTGQTPEQRQAALTEAYYNK